MYLSMSQYLSEPSYHFIVENANWSKIIEARKKGVSWNELRTRNGLSALGMAIFEGSALATQTLLEIGAPISSETTAGGQFFSPLWSALEKGKPDILEVLLQAGADPNEHHKEYNTPILYTSQNEMRAETIILCRHGASPNTHSVPSPLWLWIKNTTPYQDDNGDYVFPDSQPIIALLKNGARINMDGKEDVEIGMNEVDFARRQWLKHPLKDQDMESVLMTLSLMEHNLYSHTFSKTIPNKKEAVVKKI